MAGIPAVAETDAEDVAWALSTAETLWQKKEHRDALLWLERAAKAARLADDNARASELDGVVESLTAGLETSSDDAPAAEGADEEPISLDDADLIDDDGEDEHPAVEAATKPRMLDPWSGAARPPVPPALPSDSDVVTSAAHEDSSTRATAAPPPSKPRVPHAPPPLPRRDPRVEEDESLVTSASPLEVASRVAEAGVDSDPLDEEATLARPSDKKLVAAAIAPASETSEDAPESQGESAHAAPTVAPPQSSRGGDAAVTVAPPEGAVEAAVDLAASQDEEEALPPFRPSEASFSDHSDASYIEEEALQTPELELNGPRSEDVTKIATVSIDDEAVRSSPAPSMSQSAPDAIPSAPRSNSIDVDMDADVDADTDGRDHGDMESAIDSPIELASLLDLSKIDAFSDIPEDALEEFARAALVQPVSLNEELSGFALVILLEGEVDIVSARLKAPAERLKTNTPIMSLGRSAHKMPIRLLGARPHSLVAVWLEDDLTRALRACPWVEDELRNQADHMLAKVGLTLGPLGERLDASLRTSVLSRMSIVELAPNETLVEAGKPLPGMTVVGLGHLVVEGNQNLEPGQIAFPDCVLSGSNAPATVRAGEEGAFILQATRAATQELLMTCPPLIEIFAGM